VVEQIKGGRLTVAKRSLAEDTLYPSMVDYPKDEPF
jgi:hypothetical protein